MNIHREKKLHYTQQQIYDVISDINSYQQHLPWCSKSAVLWEKDNLLEGMIEINFGLFRYSFSTLNQITPPEKIELRLSSGPFKSLTGYWSMKKIQDNLTLVSFDLNFEFNNPLLMSPFSIFFELICSELINAFEKRMETLYSKPSLNLD
jgi:ribosome-associated toxin RatA of RatAB toxin-antitoxin module